MKIYDISQEVFHCAVYPGDTVPSYRAVSRIANGALYNGTDFAMCAHNGTHVDAPFHFVDDGKTIDQLSLEKLIGKCTVVPFEGRMTAVQAENILTTAIQLDREAARRILLKGDAIVTAEAAEVFASSELALVGVEPQSVADPACPMKAHQILLRREVILLEGIRLGAVAPGVYFLNAAPISLGGIDGAPCRAILIDGLF